MNFTPKNFTPKILTASITLAIAATAGAQPTTEAQRPPAVQQNVDPAASRAQVQIQQTAPEVTVRQGNPQIIVRQAPPTITIEQPQPEIIVLMPVPDVDVTTTRPEVDVRMPKPQVQIERAQEQAAVAVNPGEPQVQFERTGEPRMIYKQAEGKPQIRYERQARAEGAAPQANAAASTQANASTAADQERLTRERLGIGQPPTPNMAKGSPKGIRVKELEGMVVRNGKNEKLGTVDGVYTTANNDRYFVISHGGFLGMFEKEVALPAERVRLEKDFLLVNGVTDDDLKNMGNFHKSQANYRRMGASDEVRVVAAQ